MKHNLFPAVIFALLTIFFPGCTEYYDRPSIEINTIGLKKIPLSGSGVEMQTEPLFPFSVISSYEDWKKWVKYSDDVRCKAKEIFNDDSATWYCEVSFDGQDYFLINYRASTWFTDEDCTIDIVKKHTKEVVLRLQGAVVYYFSAFELNMNGEPFLVVGVNSRATSNVSMLFVVDSKFNVVYKEYLTLLKRFGYAHSDKYGNCIVIYAKDVWRATREDEWQPINGKWLYYLPKKK